MVRRSHLHCLLILAFTTTAGACASNTTPFAALPGDEPTTKACLETELPGATLVYADGSREEYNPDGSYTYLSSGAETYDAPGVYFTEDGARCIRYANGERCDRYVLRDGQLTLINRRGGSFQVARIER